jgi:hypothetical protein
MHNVSFIGVKPVDASCKTDLCFSSHAISTFAVALGLEESVDDRAALGQPILTLLQRDRADWLRAVEALIRSSARMVIAIDKGWLEDHYLDDHGYDAPMATAYEIVDGQLVATDAMLHHSRSEIFRLCAADLTQAYVVLRDGSGCWEKLSRAFAKRASIGIERAGGRWFWHHDELTTKDLIAVLREIETERLGLHRPLPGVLLSLGRR